MLHKWKIYDRVHGIALTSEKFKFIFNLEHDLIVILNKGIHTFNDWVLAAIERWTEKPPPDYLPYINIWVRLRHISFNHYTAEAISALADLFGQVVEVAFDHTKLRVMIIYVRVMIRFNISKPLGKTDIPCFLPLLNHSISSLWSLLSTFELF